MVTDSTRDRAQVILIGAIVIAFVILGVVVVLNGLVHTEEMSSSSTTQSVGHAETTQTELKSNIHQIVENQTDDDHMIESGEEVEVSNRIEKYSDASENLYGNTSSAVIAISDIYVESGDENELVRTTGNSISGGGGANAYVSGDIYRFTYNTDGKKNELDIIFETPTGNQKVNVDVDEDDDEIYIEDHNNNVCTYNKGVEIDFVSGEVNGNSSSCTIQITEISEEIDRINFEGPGAGGPREVGEYDLVVEDPSIGSQMENQGTVDPISYVDVEFEYKSTDLVTNKSTRITGFGELS